MNRDQYGQYYASADDLVDVLYQNPGYDISLTPVTDPARYNRSVQELAVGFAKLKKYQTLDETVDEFDRRMQQEWQMPEEYYQLDIAAWVLGQCNSDAELQRCGHELLLFLERDLFDLLKYLKFLVDTMRKNKIVWGVGRGSSVSSYVLYKIGVHRIDSLYYNLPIEEFLK